MKENILEDISQPPSEERSKAAVGQIKILAEFLTACLVAEDKEKMMVNFYELII